MDAHKQRRRIMVVRPRRRRHPDLFTPLEAARYLCLPGPESLPWAVENFGLPSYPAGRGRVYHRRDLDRVADLMTGTDAKSEPARSRGPRLKLG